MLQKAKSIRSPVKREAAERYILLSLVSFAASVILTRTFLSLTGYPQLGTETLHIAHVLWGGLLLFIAALLPLILANRWAFNLSAILSGVGVGLFIDEVGKFITQNNDYFYPPAAPIIYAFFLLTVLLYLHVRRPSQPTSRELMYRVLEELTEVIDRDLDLQERSALQKRLAEVAGAAEDQNTRELVTALNHFLQHKQLILVRQRVTVFQKMARRVGQFLNKTLTQPRLKMFVILTMGIMGVLALLDFVRLAGTLPYASLDAILAPLVQQGELHSAQEAIWYLIRTLLEGVSGMLLVISGGLITVGRERTGIQTGTITLIVWITVINLLVYYFDQFGAVVITLFQFFVLTTLVYYRRRYLRVD